MQRSPAAASRSALRRSLDRLARWDVRIQRRVSESSRCPSSRGFAMAVQLDEFKTRQRAIWGAGDFATISKHIADVGALVTATWTPEGVAGGIFRASAAYMPPPPDYASPPILWGTKEYVRERFGS